MPVRTRSGGKKSAILDRTRPTRVPPSRAAKQPATGALKTSQEQPLALRSAKRRALDEPVPVEEQPASKKTRKIATPAPKKSAAKNTKKAPAGQEQRQKQANKGTPKDTKTGSGVESRTQNEATVGEKVSDEGEEAVEEAQTVQSTVNKKAATQSRKPPQPRQTRHTRHTRQNKPADKDDVEEGPEAQSEPQPEENTVSQDAQGGVHKALSIAKDSTARKPRGVRKTGQQAKKGQAAAVNNPRKRKQGISQFETEETEVTKNRAVATENAPDRPTRAQRSASADSESAVSLSSATPPDSKTVTVTPGMVITQTVINGIAKHSFVLTGEATPVLDLPTNHRVRNTGPITEGHRILNNRFDTNSAPKLAPVFCGDEPKMLVPLSLLATSNLLHRQLATDRENHTIRLPNSTTETLKEYIAWKNSAYGLYDATDENLTVEVLANMYYLGIQLDDVSFRDIIITTLAQVIRVISSNENDSRRIEFDGTTIEKVFNKALWTHHGRLLFVDAIARTEGTNDLSKEDKEAYGGVFLSELYESKYKKARGPDPFGWPILKKGKEIDWKADYDGDDEDVCRAYHDHDHYPGGYRMDCAYAINRRRMLQDENPGLLDIQQPDPYAYPLNLAPPPTDAPDPGKAAYGPDPRIDAQIAREEQVRRDEQMARESEANGSAPEANDQANEQVDEVAGADGDPKSDEQIARDLQMAQDEQLARDLAEYGSSPA
ncbi:hypothetical protein K490DRAFT_69289 [Saccharata proteae CBS 121410]|uniref:Uncharacterized protein n=1 Tax=Saccharata proteae CBS 121410 TaxID=1314787 RepID=A0A9P4LTM6_9PEZI|nr:hypothetical protein K490DRAFT_69289 [Saccharata proteae CBS 121410]